PTSRARPRPGRRGRSRPSPGAGRPARRGRRGSRWGSMSTVGVPGQAGSGDAASSNIRVAVIGHVERVEFARVDHVPAPGETVHDPLPWDELADVDAAYFCAGDRGALAQGRRARVLVATAREMDLLAGAGVRLDVVAGSAIDPGERYPPDGIDPAPGAVVRTEGPRGGTYVTADGRQGRWEPALVPASPPGVLPDAYGCGDSFTGGLTFGLGTGMPLDQALALAARCGAACRAGRGAYGAQLALA